MKILNFVLVFLLTLTSIVYASASASAATNQMWATWMIDVNFENDKVNASLFIEIGDDSGVWPPGPPIPLTCTPTGGMVIANEQAVFTGRDYIKCYMPNIVEIVYQRTNGRLQLPARCLCEKTPWAEGVLRIEPTPIQPEPLNPVFYHSDLRFATPLNLGGGKGQLQFDVDTQRATSELFVLSGAMSEARAVYERVAPDEYEPAFDLDTTPLPSTPAFIQAQLYLSNEATTIYFGYSPDTGAYFEGTLAKFYVDPGCFGRG